MPTTEQATDPEPFTWKGEALDTIGTLLHAAMAAADAGEGPEFMTAYRAANPAADQNIGYIIGYVGGGDAESAARRSELNEKLGVGHPIFGASY